MNITTILEGIGLLLSLYTAIVTYHITHNKNHHPFCDISKAISCSKVLSSPYRHLLGIPNAVLGVLYFGALLAMGTTATPAFFLFATATAACMSVALTFISIYRLHNICVVCFTVNFINIVLFIIALATYS